MKNREPASQEVLRNLYDYDHSGFFKNKRTGKLVRGSSTNLGYKLLTFANYKTMLYHRAIWLWHYGWLPKQLDHRDTNRSNNKIENLREGTQKQNRANSHGRKIRNSGISSKGVHWSKKKYGTYKATIIHDGKYIHLGTFSSEKEAADAFDAATLKLNGEFGRGNSCFPAP